MARKTSTAALFLFASTPVAAAFEASPLVITGSRFQAPVDTQPFSVERIDLSPSRHGQPGIGVAEVLQAVPGLSVRQRHNLAQEPQLSMRGFGARSAFGVRGIKLISDGIPASIPDGQGQASSFDLDTLAHIEVLRGPFASLYGSNSGGVIQLFSRDGMGEPHVTDAGARGAIGLALKPARIGVAWY